MSGRFFLAPLIFACPTRHGMVLLDVRRNRYLGLGIGESQTLFRNVDGLPSPSLRMDVAAIVTSDISAAAGASTTTISAEGGLLGSLLREGIITTEAPRSAEIVSAAITLHGPLMSIGDEMTKPSRARIHHVTAFLVYLIYSAVSLRYLPLRFVVRHVYRRRAAAIANGYTFDLSKVSELIDIFRSIRPYFFIARNNCLLHALTLVNFLAHYGEFPVWVFGVTADPWTAHSWVQHDRFLLDCNPEKVCNLEPILGV